jgi:hypothetical protein
VIAMLDELNQFDVIDMVQPAHSTMRTYAMAAGLYGTAVAIIIDALYSVFHVLWPVSSTSDSPIYFLLELGLIVLATAGSFVLAAQARLGAALLVLAVLGAFASLGWWALLIAPLWLLAAFLAYLDFARSEGRLRSTEQESGKTSVLQNLPPYPLG